MTFDLFYMWVFLGVVASLLIVKELLGIVIIPEDQVGIVNKKFSSKDMIHGQIIALNGEAGIQADILTVGWHFFYFRWQFEVIRQGLIIVPAGQIALVNAKDGKTVEDGRMLSKSVDCLNFQDARKFLEEGGERGRQISTLREGIYRINTELFEVVTKANCQRFDVQGSDLDVLYIKTDYIGIVTTLDGKLIKKGEIAGAIVEGHDGFQNPQVFIANGGERGLQEQVLQSGDWKINPWFAKVEVKPITVINVGEVGVVLSHVGAAAQDVSGEAFKHGDLVEPGHKGVWATPLSPGKHAINPYTMKVVSVPTTNIALNWSKKRETHGLDDRLESLVIRSRDGFSFDLDITQVIHVGAKDAPKVISRFGTMNQLINQVLEPAIDNYFRNSAQKDTILEFLNTRVERQAAALEFIKPALDLYNIEAVATYIGLVKPPEELMKTQTDRKLAEENQITYAVEEKSQKALQSLKKETALADMQGEIVQAEQKIVIDENEAKAKVAQAKGEAESATVRAEADAKVVELKSEADAKATLVKGDAEAKTVEAVGLAKAKVYEASVKAMGGDNYARLQVMQVIGEKGVKLIPDTLIMGGSGDSSSSPLMLQAMIAESLTGQKLFDKTKAAEKSTVTVE